MRSIRIDYVGFHDALMTPDPGSPRAEPEVQPTELFGLTGLRAQPRERVPIRTRASGVTRAAWRLPIASDQGTGAIVMVEASPQESYYRGEGIFLGWAQERLAAVHDALLPKCDEPPFDMPQLG
jgi:hypothetical protein